MCVVFVDIFGEVIVMVFGGLILFLIFVELVKVLFDWLCFVVWLGDDCIVVEDYLVSNVGCICVLFELVGVCIVLLVEGVELLCFVLVWFGMGNDGYVVLLFFNIDLCVDVLSVVLWFMFDLLLFEVLFDWLSLIIFVLVCSDVLVFVVCGEEKVVLFCVVMVGVYDLLVV